MVRLATSFIFIAGLVVSGIATPFKRTVAQVEADIASISSQTTTLDNNIKSFANPGGTLAQALVCFCCVLRHFLRRWYKYTRPSTPVRKAFLWRSILEQPMSRWEPVTSNSHIDWYSVIEYWYSFCCRWPYHLEQRGSLWAYNPGCFVANRSQEACICRASSRRYSGSHFIRSSGALCCYQQLWDCLDRCRSSVYFHFKKCEHFINVRNPGVSCHRSNGSKEYHRCSFRHGYRCLLVIRSFNIFVL